MKWSKSKLAILIAAIVTIATVAYAADNVIINPTQDEDTVIKVNDGGVVKEILRADSSENKLVLTNPTSIDIVSTRTVSADKTITASESVLIVDPILSGGVTYTVNGIAYLAGTFTGDGVLAGTGTIVNIDN